MKLLSGVQEWADCAIPGNYFFSLLSKPSWVHRRVETVSLVNRVAAERHVSIDIDVSDLVSRAEKAGYESPKRVYFPLTLLRKVVLADLDVFDDDGKTLSVVTSDRDSHAAHAVLLETAREIGHDPETFSHQVVQTLYDIVRNPPTLADQLAIESSWYRANRSVDAWGLPEAGLTVSDADLKLWEELFANEKFVTRTAELTLKYMPIVSIDTHLQHRVVKFRTYEPLVKPISAIGFRERIGILPGLFNIDAPSIGRAQREHVRIIAPGGTFLTSATLGTPPAPPTTTQNPTTPITGKKYIRRITPEKGVIYSWGASPGTYQVHFGLRPSLNDFRASTLVALLGTLVLLGLGAASQWTFETLEKIAEDRSEPAVALLLVIPTIAVAYVTREGEHEIRAHLLEYMRLLVGSVGFATLIAAIVIIIRLPGLAIAIIWTAMAAWCLVVLLVFSYTTWRIERQREKVVAQSSTQQQRTMLNYLALRR